MSIKNLYKYEVKSKSIVFHEYNITYNDKIIHSLRSSEGEVKDILFLFDLVATLAKENPNASFPLTIVEEEVSATIFGPVKENKNWGPVIKGPKNIIKNLFDPLMNEFSYHQSLKNNKTLKI